MSKAKVIAVAVAALAVVAIRWTDASATDVQGAVRSLEYSLAQAVRAKDLDAIMKLYTVSEHLVVFDLVPPRQYTGWKAYKEDWRKFLAGCKDSTQI
jgi:ketosteroid isomerase-like protein